MAPLMINMHSGEPFCPCYVCTYRYTHITQLCVVYIVCMCVCIIPLHVTALVTVNVADDIQCAAKFKLKKHTHYISMYIQLYMEFYVLLDEAV